MKNIYLKDRFEKENILIFKNIENSIENKKIGVTHILGESGIGRTSLIKEIYNNLIDLNKNSNIVLTSNEAPIGKFNIGDLQPYKLFTQIIQSLKENKQISSEKKLALNAGLTLLTAVPFLGDAVYAAKELSKDWRYYKQEKLGSIDAKDETSLDLIGAIESYAKKQPLIILIDDTQWCDKQSLELLNLLSLELADYPIHFVITSNKNNENNYLKSLIKLFKNKIHFSEIELETLTFEEIKTICANFQKYFDNDELNKWLLKKTQGNPSYLFELLKYLNRNNPFDESGTLILNLNSEIFLSLDNYSVIDKINDVLSIDEKQLLSIATCEGRIFSAYLLANIFNSDVLTIIKRLKEITLKSDIIQSKGMEIFYGVKSTVYEFTQTNYLKYFDSLLEYEERISVHSNIVKILQDTLKNTNDEELKESLIPYIAAHSAEAENDKVYDEMLKEFEVLNNKYGIGDNYNSNKSNNLANDNSSSEEINEDSSDLNKDGNLNSNNSSSNSNDQKLTPFLNYRRKVSRYFENENYNEIIDETNKFVNDNSLKELENIESNSFLIRTYTNLNDFASAKTIIDQTNKLLNKNSNNTIAECFYLNSVAVYYFEIKKYNQSLDTLQTAAKKSLKLPLELKLLTLMNINNLLKVISPDQTKNYQKVIDKLKTRVTIKL